MFLSLSPAIRACPYIDRQTLFQQKYQWWTPQGKHLFLSPPDHTLMRLNVEVWFMCHTMRSPLMSSTTSRGYWINCGNTFTIGGVALLCRKFSHSHLLAYSLLECFIYLKKSSATLELRLTLDAIYSINLFLTLILCPKKINSEVLTHWDSVYVILTSFSSLSGSGESCT